MSASPPHVRHSASPASSHPTTPMRPGQINHNPSAPAKTIEDLEWPRVRDAVAVRCRSESTRAAGLPLASSFEGAQRALDETAEAMRLLAEDEPLPLDGIRDVRAHLQRLQRGGALDAPALAEVLSQVRAGRALRRFLAARKERLPRLWSACAIDPSLGALEGELAAALQPDGTLADHASPTLRELRREVANLRARIIGRLEEILHKRQDILQDRYYTVREGRYVVPVRHDAHERLHGIVHGTSSTGATVFVEPRALVAQGNRLKMAQADLDREIARILAELSELARERLPALQACAQTVEHADLRDASARLGRELGACVPHLVDEGRTQLRAARHPLLVLEGLDVVPNDIELEPGRALVISGPNAGGKTVALKMLGLAALMVRAGLPLPAEEGSVCGYFAEVLTDVGDDQSTLRNLSSFSAHVSNLSSMLSVAGGRSLVLLDELASATDPEEGAALAYAVLDAFCRAGSAIAVTTHYEPLKAAALKDARLRNASVGFDVGRMEPTFELLLDVPGGSSALAVAQRYGIPEDVVAFARRIIPEQSRAFEDLSHQLGEEVRVHRRAREELTAERARLERARQALEQERARLKERGRRQLEQETQALMGQVREARQELEQARTRIRREELDRDALREAQKSVDRSAEKLAVGGELDMTPAREPSEASAEPLEIQALQSGDRVYVPRLRGEGVVVEAPQKGKIRVAVGPMKLWVEADELRSLRGEPSGSTTPEPAGAPRESARDSASRPATGRTEDNTLDVRGLRVDDAISMLESFVDRLYGAGFQTGYVLHGRGTGALRDAVRASLVDASRYVSERRRGSSEEGGDAVTVFRLK